jgi:hypothetical protein
MYRAILITLICIISQAGCSSSDSNSGKLAGSPLAPEYGLTEKPYTSLQRVWAPKEPSPEVRAMMDDGRFTVYEHQRYAKNGLGASLEAGIPWIEHRELAPDFPGEGNKRRSLAYILAIADPQIIDEESPIRMDGFSAVYRPHGQLTPQLFEEVKSQNLLLRVTIHDEISDNLAAIDDWPETVDSVETLSAF